MIHNNRRTKARKTERLWKLHQPRTRSSWCIQGWRSDEACTYSEHFRRCERIGWICIFNIRLRVKIFGPAHASCAVRGRLETRRHYSKLMSFEILINDVAVWKSKNNRLSPFIWDLAHIFSLSLIITTDLFCTLFFYFMIVHLLILYGILLYTCVNAA